ncbi:hypothetical protein AB0B86_10285 [Micromonospora sp. NPDC049047]|uniref:hypothetical protein n=1 Tax=Micromonospora sp. NPDC049047 TaxID=3155645 RepID=UPI0033DD1C7F
MDRGTPAGARVSSRPDGLLPAGWVQGAVLDEECSGQDHGCFPPEDPFAMSRNGDDDQQRHSPRLPETVKNP